MIEIWKDIKGYEGLYKISNCGRVKSLRRNIIMKIALDNYNYYHINFQVNNISETIKIHRLVALNFIPNPDNKPQVNHIDGNKKNNHVSNLEWCTNQENSIHAHKIGLVKNKNNNHLKKPIRITKGNFSKTFDSMVDCSIYLNVSNKTISNNIKRNCKSKGYTIELI